MSRSDSVKKVDIIKIIVNWGRRFIIYTVQNFAFYNWVHDFCEISMVFEPCLWFGSRCSGPEVKRWVFAVCLLGKKTGVPVGGVTASAENQVIYTSVLGFFHVKTKSVRETFCCFLPFISRMQIHFHARILRNFHGQSKVCTDTFSDFFTGTINFFTGRGEKIDGFLYSSQKSRAQYPQVPPP